MKPIYRCDYCPHTGTAEEVLKHEEACVYNKTKRSCYTCGYRKGWGIRTFNCQKEVEIPEGKYMENCPNWTEDKREFDVNNPMASVFDSFFGKA